LILIFNMYLYYIMSNKTKKKENTYFENYDLYSDANPKDTIRIKYDTLANLKITIRKLESIYKKSLYPHIRISQIANVLNQRLKVIVKNTGKGKDRLLLAEKYFSFLKDRTQLKNEKERKKLVFKM